MLCSDTSMCCILHIYDSVYDVNYAITRVQHNTLKSCCYRFIGLKYEGMKTKVLPGFHTSSLALMMSFCSFWKYLTDRKLEVKV